MLHVDSVTKSFTAGASHRQLFSEVSFELRAGTFTVLLGRSGSGKSTLLNLIAGLDRPDTGRIIVDGKDLTRLGGEQLAAYRLRSVGLVFQFFNLLPTLTLSENIALPALLAGKDSRAVRLQVERSVAAVDLGGAAARLPHQVSGGELQRAAIARALVNEPLLLLADEPTGNLDEANALGVIRLFTELARERGATLLVVTHDRSLTEGADRVLELTNGTLSAHD